MTWIDPLSRRLHRNSGRHGPVMLLYHAVTPGRATPEWPWAVSMRQFCNQVDFLAAEGYSTPTVAELVAIPAASWGGRTAVITFDDGYADNLIACEALEKRAMRATWFIVSGSIGQPPLWLADDRPQGRLLNASELREMRASGMEIGSHTVSHARLTECGDASLMQELVDSRAALEVALSHAVSSFAYPYGLWDKRSAGALNQAGYTAACTTRTGWALRDNDPYLIRRLTVFNTDTVNTLARKLCFASNDVGWLELARYAFRRIAGA